MLLGREPERERIERLVVEARAGASGVLVLRGEPGIGKSALLEHAAAAAGDATVLRVRGVESEVEVAFAGLSELLRPALGELGRLPAPQARALDAALGLAPAAAAEPQLVGAATLGLLAALAEQRPVVVLADDVHWLDRPSSSALVFAARRLLADAVAVVLALRPGEAPAVEAAELETLTLAGLGAEPARALLEAHAARPVAADTAAWLHAATGGNPLALVEAAAEAPRLRPGPVGGQVPIGAPARARGRPAARAAPGGRGPRAAGGGGRRRRGDRAGARRGARARRVGGRARGGGGGRAGRAGARAASRSATRSRARSCSPAPRRGSAARRTARTPRRSTPRASAPPGTPRPARSSPTRAWRARWRRPPRRPEGAAATPQRRRRSSRPRGSRPIRRGARSGCARPPTPPGSPATVRARSRCSTTPRRSWRDGAPLDAAVAERAEAAHLRGRVLARRGPVPLAVRTLAEGAEAVAAADPAKAAEMLAEAAFATLYGDSPAADMEQLGRRAVALVPAGEPRARAGSPPPPWARSSSCRGARRPPNGSPKPPRWPRRPRRCARIRGSPRWSASRPRSCAAARTPTSRLARAIALARERGAAGVLPFALFYLGVGMLASPRWAEAATHFEEALRLAGEAGLRVDAVAALAALTRLEARRGGSAGCRARPHRARPRPRVRHPVLRGVGAARAGRAGARRRRPRRGARRVRGEGRGAGRARAARPRPLARAGARGAARARGRGRAPWRPTRSRPPRPRAGRGRSRAPTAPSRSPRPTTPPRSTPTRRRSRCTRRRTTSTSAPAPSCASASACAGPAAAPTRASRCAPRSTRSTRSARSRGRSAPAPSCGPPARPPGAATRPRSTS